MTSQTSSSSQSTPTAPLLRSLRAAILSSPLAKGPKALSGSIRLHVVFSTPKSAKQLYPLAYVSSANSRNGSDPEQQRLGEIRRGIVKDGMVDAWEEQIFVTATWNPNENKDTDRNAAHSISNDENNDDAVNENGPRMIYALESYLYTLPSEQSALLYVSKLDSTGFGPKPDRDFNKPGNEKLMEYLEIIELEKERDLQEREKKKKNEMLANLTGGNSSPSSMINSNKSSPKPTENNNSTKPTIVRSGSFTGFNNNKDQSPKPIKPISTAASSLYTTSKSSLTNLITHSFLHHFCSLSHWSPPPNLYLSINSSPPPLPRISLLGSSSNTMPIKHLSLHILARSQATYLFPGSPENKNKRVLSDTGLIKWWKKCTEGVIRHIRLEADENQKLKSDLFDDVRLKEGKINPIPALPKSSSSASSASSSSSMSPTATTTALASGSNVKLDSIGLTEDIKHSNESELKRSSKIIKESSSVPGILTNSSMDIRPYYLIPGYNRLESHPLVPINSSNDVDWIYGHPYSRDVEDPAPLPLHLPTFFTKEKGSETAEDGKAFSIATLIPHFPDDPKSRFLDELARDAHEHAGNYDEKKSKSVEREGQDQREVEEEGPETKRPRLEENNNNTNGKEREVENQESGSSNVPISVSVATSASDSTNSNSTSTSTSTSVPRITSQQKHLSRERAALDHVSPNEFWERMGYRQECCSGNVVGAFVIGFTTRTENPSISSSSNNTYFSNQKSTSTSNSSTNTTPISTSPKARPLNLPNPTLPDLILKHLLRDACDWSNLKSAIELTKSWERGLKKAVLHRGGLSSSSSPAPSSSSGSEISEEEKLKNVAKGILWADLDLNGPCEKENLDQALKKWKEENEVEFTEVMKLREDFEKRNAASDSGGMNETSNTNNGSTNANVGNAKVNTLSVKRKRKI